MRAVLLLVVVAACQGHSEPGRSPTPGLDPGSAHAGSGGTFGNASPGSGSAGSAGSQSDDATGSGSADEPDPIDPDKAIAELGAVSAWQAVIDRAQYLARRGQHGVVFGTVGPALLVPGLVTDATDA